MSINEQGFLSPDLDGYRAKFREVHAAYFDLVKRVSRFCHETKFKIRLHGRDGQRIFAVSLFIKLMQDEGFHEFIGLANFRHRDQRL